MCETRAGPSSSSHLTEVNLTPLANPNPPPQSPHSLNTLALPFWRLLESTLTWVVMGSRHLDIAEGDRERSQRTGSTSATSETFQLSPEAEGRAAKSGKCFSNLSSVTHCLHGVIKDHLGFCLEGERKSIFGCGGALMGWGGVWRVKIEALLFSKSSLSCKVHAECINVSTDFSCLFDINDDLLHLIQRGVSSCPKT